MPYFYSVVLYRLKFELNKSMPVQRSKMYKFVWLIKLYFMHVQWSSFCETISNSNKDCTFIGYLGCCYTSFYLCHVTQGG